MRYPSWGRGDARKQGELKMERRKFLIGAGSAAIGTSALVGSGAFSYVRADRNAQMDVVSDSNAYLKMSSTSEYASEDSDGKLTLQFNGANDQNGEGLNANADSRFDNVFAIKNNGTNDISQLSVQTGTDGGWDADGLELYYTRSPVDGHSDFVSNAEPLSKSADDGDTPSIATGNSIYIHAIFWLRENSESDLPDTIGITAES
jgi:hypothetical protein